MFKNTKKNPIQVTLSVLHNFFTKLILLNSKNSTNKLENIGIHPYFLKDYQLAARNFPLNKSIQIIHLLKQTDLKSKGVNKNRINEKELMLDLVLDIMAI